MEVRIPLETINFFDHPSLSFRPGLPKPARMTQRRLTLASQCIYFFGVGSSDVVYIPLPMYHSAGFCVGLMNVIRSGQWWVQGAEDFFISFSILKIWFLKQLFTSFRSDRDGHESFELLSTDPEKASISILSSWQSPITISMLLPFHYLFIIFAILSLWHNARIWIHQI